MSRMPKNKTPSTERGGAYRGDSPETIVASADFQATRAKEPIFGPAVPVGEEFEFPRKEYKSHEDVIDTVEATVYDVLNGMMPQQKGEFLLRAMGTVTKSLIARSDANGAASANAAIGRVLAKEAERAKDPQMVEFEKAMAHAETKLDSK